MNTLNKKQKGFTLVELVVVVAVVGILAIVATPKLVGVAGSARDAALQGVVSALTAASTRNAVIRSTDNSKGVAVAKCSDVAATLQGGLPEGYEFFVDSVSTIKVDDGATVLAHDAVGTCKLSTETAPRISKEFDVVGSAAA